MSGSSRRLALVGLVALVLAGALWSGATGGSVRGDDHAAPTAAPAAVVADWAAAGAGAVAPRLRSWPDADALPLAGLAKAHLAGSVGAGLAGPAGALAAAAGWWALARLRRRVRLRALPQFSLLAARRAPPAPALA